MNDSKPGQTDPKGEVWSPEEINFLRENRHNFSLSALAEKLGRTRGAVAGKSKRIGIKTTTQHHKQMISRARASSERVGKRTTWAKPEFTHIQTKFVRGGRAEPKHMIEPDVGILNGVGVKIGEIESHHCKWVVGEPADFTCCGQKRLEGSPYCENHHKIAYKARINTDGRR